MIPKVIFDLSKLEKNIQVMNKRIPNMKYLFPVKCCNNKKVLELVSKNKWGFDISNKNEFKLIKPYLKNQFVSVSGPLSYELQNCNYSNIHIVNNSINYYQNGNGIRINFNSNNKFNKSRFGVDYKLLNSEVRKKISYVHFHNSDDKDLLKCEAIYKELKNIVKYFPNLVDLNIGGNLDCLTFEEGLRYLEKVRKIVPQRINMYAELGNYTFKNVGTLFCEVIDICYDNNYQIVTLNISKMANQRWTLPFYISSHNDEEKMSTIFGSCTCCETDIYLETKANKLKIGDKVMFGNIYPYSYQWNTSFNGVDKIKYIFK